MEKSEFVDKNTETQVRKYVDINFRICYNNKYVYNFSFKAKNKKNSEKLLDKKDSEFFLCKIKM